MSSSNNWHEINLLNHRENEDEDLELPEIAREASASASTSQHVNHWPLQRSETSPPQYAPSAQTSRVTTKKSAGWKKFQLYFLTTVGLLLIAAIPGIATYVYARHFDSHETEAEIDSKPESFTSSCVMVSTATMFSTVPSLTTLSTTLAEVSKITQPASTLITVTISDSPAMFIPTQTATRFHD